MKKIYLLIFLLITKSMAQETEMETVPAAMPGFEGEVIEEELLLEEGEKFQKAGEEVASEEKSEAEPTDEKEEVPSEKKEVASEEKPEAEPTDEKEEVPSEKEEVASEEKPEAEPTDEEEEVPSEKEEVASEEKPEAEPTDEEEVVSQEEVPPKEEPVVQVIPTPEVTFEQPKWPDALEISEETPKLVKIPWSQDFKNILKEADQINLKIKNYINKLRENRKQLNQKYLKVDKKLDEFLQDISFLYGEIMEEESKKPVHDYALEWEKIKKEVDGIDRSEDEILKQLAKLDDQIDVAISEAFEVHKISVGILKVSEQKAAQDGLNKLKDSLKKIKGIQDNLQKTLIKNIDKSLDNLELQMQEIDGKVNVLKTKRKAKEIEFEDEMEIEDEKEKEEITESKLFVKTVNVVAISINFLKKTGNWLLDVCGKIGRWLEKVSKGEKEDSDSVLQNIKSKIELLDISIKELEEEKKGVTQKRRELEKLKKERVDKIKEKLELIKKGSHEKSVVDKEDLKDISKKPKWRVVVENLFDKFLDTMTFIVRKTKEYSVWFYKKVLKVKFARFVVAVKKRSEAIEEDERRSILEIEEEVISEPPPSSLEEVVGLEKEAEEITVPSEEGVGVPEELGFVGEEMGGQPPTVSESVEPAEKKIFLPAEIEVPKK